MKKVTARAVCEGAIVAALTVLLMFMGIYVPVLLHRGGSLHGIIRYHY